MQYSQEFVEYLEACINLYDKITQEICDKFLEEVWLSEQKIKSNPFAFLLVSNSGFRRLTLHKFPYKIFFKVEGEIVFIIALIHSACSNKFVKRILAK